MSHGNPLLQSISHWFRRNFSDPAAVGLFFTLLFTLIFLECFGHFFMPVLISVVLAYLLLSVVRQLEQWHIPHYLAVVGVFSIFMGLVIVTLVWLLPIIVHELQNLVTEAPITFSQGHNWFKSLMQKYPAVFSDARFQESMTYVQSEVAHWGQLALKHLWGLIPNLITVVLYFILVPLLLFFFLKDSKQIAHWFSQFLPKHRSLIAVVSRNVKKKIGCYVRGRVIEIIVIAIVTWIVFSILGMNYAALLATLVGLSVIIPYIGAVVATIPVVVIALMQWGVSPDFFYLLIAYSVIIALDANILVPLLFAETMDLHPIVIILSVLVFGGLWGFWGVFFAIPLATVADVVLRAWPSAGE
ncbi:MAG: AI-2E family transporter [Coxiellaceae bacterium]|nr:AI-2E family transporter [Coxiellaceae bacterium]